LAGGRGGACVMHSRIEAPLVELSEQFTVRARAWAAKGLA
jgi:hypothetical protein